MFLSLQVVAAGEGRQGLGRVVSDPRGDLRRPHAPSRSGPRRVAVDCVSSIVRLSSPSLCCSLHPENKSYSSVRTEALSVVDMIVKRTGGEKTELSFPQ